MSGAQCQCGTVKFEVTGKPLLRTFCHCTICQRVNKSAYADIVLFKQKDVVMPDSSSLVYKAEANPPVLQRGTCQSCDLIAVEYLKLFPLPKIIIVPTANIEDQALIPDLSLHIFYHSRVHDMADDVPKYEGYLKSQAALGKQLVSAMMR